MDSLANPFLSTAATSDAASSFSSSSSPASSFFLSELNVVEPTTHSTAEDDSNKLSSAVQVTNTARIPALALPFATSNDAVEGIHEKLPAAWSQLSEAERLEVVGWVETFDKDRTEYLLKKDEICILGQNTANKCDKQKEYQNGWFSVFIINDLLMISNFMTKDILVNGVAVSPNITCTIENKSFINPVGFNVCYIAYKVESLTLRTDDQSHDFDVVINSRYAVTTQQLGAGGFGEVYYGETRCNKMPIAAKISKKQKAKGAANNGHFNIFDEEKDMIIAAQEHSSIIKLVGAHNTELHSYLILEYLNGGNLFNYCTCHGPLPEQEAKYIFQQILNGVKHLHDRNIVHLDIKLENILLRQHAKYPSIVITDFGLARKLVSKNPTINGICGTIGYMAPDAILRSKNSNNNEIILQNKRSLKNILCGSQFTEQGYGKDADQWSLGVTLHALLSNTMPYTYDTKNKYGSYIINVLNSPLVFGDLWKSVSKEARNLVRGLLAIDRNSRLTVEQALESAWFTEPLKESSNPKSIQETLDKKEEEKVKNVENVDANENTEAEQQEEVAVEKEEPVEKEEEIAINSVEESGKNSIASNVESAAQDHLAVPVNQHGIKRARSSDASSDQPLLKNNKN
ncbi:kinase-like domain-containing protein [Syncephalis fuscata]|nr:kinase-like domain-containing protein [Syncephalis fuscata]